jgi:hypothetical protein
MGFTLAIGQGIAKKTRNQEEILDGSFPFELDGLL